MKKKKNTHPKLYLDVICKQSDVLLTFISNKFDNNGKRQIEKEVLKDEMKNNKKKYLINLNTVQLDFLKKYIEVQKRVLVKHQKDGNYDSVRVVNYSLSSMEEYKKIFENWFNKNKK